MKRGLLVAIIAMITVLIMLIWMYIAPDQPYWLVCIAGAIAMLVAIGVNKDKGEKA